MSDSTADKLAFLAFGWLLGLLWPIIVDSIKRRRENTLGRAAILTELTELAGTLATVAYGARMKLGAVDRAFLEWLKVTLEQCETAPKLQAFVPRLRTQLPWTDDQCARQRIGRLSLLAGHRLLNHGLKPSNY